MALATASTDSYVGLPYHVFLATYGPGITQNLMSDTASSSDHEDDSSSNLTTSDYDDESFAESISIPSGIRNHLYWNDRRYHSYRCGRYPVPNDEIEQEREKLLHIMAFTATGGRLGFAPIGEHPQKILDLGTGTGLWAIDTADRFPSAQVHGVDLSPIQPWWIAPNCKFIIDDIEDSWENGGDWDYIHMRNVLPILRDPNTLLKNIYTNLKPGGFIELQDVDGKVHCDDGTLTEDWPLLNLTRLANQAFAQMGTRAHAASDGRAYLEKCGFINIQHNVIKLPLGAWPQDERLKQIGDMFRKAAEDFVSAMVAVHLPLLGYSKQQAEGLFAECQDSLARLDVHAYGLMHFWTGQKPERVTSKA